MVRVQAAEARGSNLARNRAVAVVGDRRRGKVSCRRFRPQSLRREGTPSEVSRHELAAAEWLLTRFASLTCAGSLRGASAYYEYQRHSPMLADHGARHRPLAVPLFVLAAMRTYAHLRALRGSVLGVERLLNVLTCARFGG